jgi:hypothetical protein
LDADSVEISGGGVLAVGHSGNSSKSNRYYYSEEAVDKLTEAAAGVFEKPLPFEDVS